MKTIASLIAELQKFPPDALTYAYEGEVRGIIVVGPRRAIYKGGGTGHPQLGYVPATENDKDDGEAIIEPEQYVSELKISHSTVVYLDGFIYGRHDEPGPAEYSKYDTKVNEWAPSTREEFENAKRQAHKLAE